MNQNNPNVRLTRRPLFRASLLLLSACLLQQPTASAQPEPGSLRPVPQVALHVTPRVAPQVDPHHDLLATEGVWQADVRPNGIQMRFEKEGYAGKGVNGTSFSESEFSRLPREQPGAFTLTREAGTMEFTGKFDGNKGQGRYRFVANPTYRATMQKVVADDLNDLDQMTLFFVNAKAADAQMFNRKGYSELRKDDVIALTALHVDEAYLQSLQQSGMASLSLENVVAFKALGIDAPYIKALRDAGYTDFSAEDVIVRKASGRAPNQPRTIRPLPKTPQSKKADDR
ncbi:MAG TPA: hypothetical protein VF629_06645 [Hymenobacter sp.]|jgi:hypothetical protein|uniref:hypothetical protein n=1 Tax=Hymenobacter sp. TaxID=1898978 RepID=UPI002ED794A2